MQNYCLSNYMRIGVSTSISAGNAVSGRIDCPIVV